MKDMIIEQFRFGSHAPKRFCKVCGKSIKNRNKTGLCRSCRIREFWKPIQK